MSAELADKMRGRIDQCRRLARTTTDPKAAEMLRQIADEGEKDLQQLLAEESGTPIEIRLGPPPGGSAAHDL